MSEQANAFTRLISNPFKARLFLLSRLPSAYFSGLRIADIREESGTVTVPYKWFSKNPFRSTYFACLAMAAEMSSGILCLMRIYQSKPAVSMLVTKMEANYYKKATGVTSFICSDGILIKETIEKAIASGEAQVITVRSTGTNNSKELVATFDITWSFKAKS